MKAKGTKASGTDTEIGSGRVKDYFSPDLIPDPFIILNSDGTIADMNQSFGRLIGLHRDELLGRPYSDFELLKICSGKVAASLAGATEEVDTLVYQNRNIEVFIMPFRMKDGVTLIRIILKDISNLASLEQELLKRNRELIIINTLSSAFISSDNMDLVVEELLNKVLLVTDFRTGWLMVKDGESFSLKTSKDLSPEFILAVADGQLDLLCSGLVQTCEPLCVMEPAEIAGHECLRREDLKFLTSVPLVFDREITGILFLADRGERASSFNFDFAALLSLVGNHISMILDKIRLFQETKRLSITDGLTGLYNSRYFYKQLEIEIARSNRYGSSFSLILFDIDRFKLLNDTYGHQAGDDVLLELGRILRAESRETDIVVRYGGEEFIIILPNTPEEDTINLADRIRVAVKDHIFLRDTKGGLSITLSGGIASYPRNAGTSKTLLNAADIALYSAKAAGKNRVVCFMDRIDE